MVFWISSKKLKKLTDKIESAEKEVADLKAQLENYPKVVAKTIEDALTQAFMERAQRPEPSKYDD
ncbi:hypothetical protein I7G59_06560 [Sinorhizobium meliloti]|uniref:hypothetical protein n=1 Tax=Rhizobium meliloti TaxID=382 RepID=UPI00238030BE|nr:hypothetical protein [Sinorhizobium meliloti]MDE3796996.1 hypothetical protein [Sinorhizobium meliloti]